MEQIPGEVGVCMGKTICSISATATNKDQLANIGRLVFAFFPRRLTMVRFSLLLPGVTVLLRKTAKHPYLIANRIFESDGFRVKRPNRSKHRIIFPLPQCSF